MKTAKSGSTHAFRATDIGELLLAPEPRRGALDGVAVLAEDALEPAPPSTTSSCSNGTSAAMSFAPDATALDLNEPKNSTDPRPSGFMAVNQRWKTLKEAKDELLEELESNYLREVLERSGGNMTLAARYAGVARGHFYRLMKKRGLAR